MSWPTNRTGIRYGRLTAIRPDRLSASGNRAWVCQCDCGTEVVVCGSKLSGRTRSCGCLAKESAAAVGRALTTHGLTRTPEYAAWQNMKARCYRPSAKLFDRYGGRGIQVCGRWLTGEEGRSGFECFLSDLGPRPTAKHSVERRDVDGHYAPTNCTWATTTQQARNKTSTVFVDWDGERVPLATLCEREGVPLLRAWHRIKKQGMAVADAIRTPPRSIGRRRSA